MAIPHGSNQSINTLTFLIHQEVVDYDELIRLVGEDPRKRRVAPHVRQYRTVRNGEIIRRFTTEDIPESELALTDLSLDDLFNGVKRFDKRRLRRKKSGRRALVIAMSDEQLGKVDRFGGTPETLQRLEDIKAMILPYATEMQPDLIVQAHGGDLTEGDQSTTAQRATNDLSVTRQGEVGQRYRTDWMLDFASIAPQKAGGCVSNHDVERIGKGLAYKPFDDRGITVNRLAVETVTRLGFVIEACEPESEYIEWTIIDVFGWKIGIIHGHQVRGGSKGVKAYFDKHIANNTSLAAVDILIVAHNHEEYVLQIGRTAKGRARTAIGLAPLDNGSAWFTNLSAADSDPGVTTFVVNEETGLDLRSIQRWHRAEDMERAMAA